jgi:hypothetical protein
VIEAVRSKKRPLGEAKGPFCGKTTNILTFRVKGSPGSFHRSGLPL